MNAARWKRWATVILISAGCIALFAGCHFLYPSHPAKSSLALPPSHGDWAEAAERTFFNYVRAPESQGNALADEIPRTFWDERISALKPVKAYMHRLNIVVVQRIASGREEGVYIHNPLSSYLPDDGVDGFKLDPNPEKNGLYCLGDGVFNYSRQIAGK